MENVPLKKNIFRSWGLPIEVRSGVVGRIKIEFNLLKYLRNEPVLVSIEDIYLVAGPLNLAEVKFCLYLYVNLLDIQVLQRCNSLLINNIIPDTFVVGSYGRRGIGSRN